MLYSKPEKRQLQWKNMLCKNVILLCNNNQNYITSLVIAVHPRRWTTLVIIAADM